MAEETTTTPPPPVGAGFRDRISDRVFREQVRKELEAELKGRARKKGSTFGVGAVPSIVASVPDDEIDRCRAAVESQAAAADGPPPVVGGPILDWLRDPANRERVLKVVQMLLALLLA